MTQPFVCTGTWLLGFGDVEGWGVSHLSTEGDSEGVSLRQSEDTPHACAAHPLRFHGDIARPTPQTGS
jgi:hypothetical protein